MTTTKGGRELSRKPSQVRNRLRRRIGQADEELALLMEVDPRYKPLDQWDYEELARGIPRSRNGSFQGQPRGSRTPRWLTPAVQEEIRRRLKVKAMAALTSEIKPAIEVMSSIMNDPNEDSRLRLDAAKFIIEQVLGKAKQAIDVEVSDRVRTMLATALVLDDGSPAHPVLELEETEYTVEDEEEDD